MAGLRLQFDRGTQLRTGHVVAARNRPSHGTYSDVLLPPSTEPQRKTGLQRTGCGFALRPRFTAVAEGSAKNRYFAGENLEVEPVTIGSWCRKRDSNPRPRHYE